MRFLFFLILYIPVLLQGNSDTLYNISHLPGFYDSEIKVLIESSNGDLFYNSRGKLANRRSKKIKGPISIKETTSINLALYKNKKLIFRKSLTYFIDFKTDLPVVSIYINPNDLWSESRGIYVKGPNAVWDSVGNYWKNANFFKKWEKKVFFEFFEDNKKRVVAQNSGLKLFGGLSRQLKDKSLRLIAREEYGDSRFKHNFFKNINSKKYKSLVLRTSGGDYNKSRFKDVFITQLAREINIPTQNSRPAILFVNGKYWGVYNIREKIDERFLERNFGVSKEDLDLLQGRMTAEYGSNLEYKKMLDFIKNNDLKFDQNYDSLHSMMDISNYTDYIITQLYIANKDSRGNVRFWKYPKNDGKFKWILYDTDLSFGTGLKPSFNFFQKLISPVETDWYNPEWSTFLLRNLLKNNKFRVDFFNRMCFLLSTTYSPENVISKIDYYANIYEPEMPRHFNSKPGSFKNWLKYVDKFKVFATERPSYFIKNVADEFNYHNSYDLFIDNNSPDLGTVNVNGIELQEGSFKGVFYKENNLKITASNKIKYEFAGWGDFKGDSELILNINNIKGDKVILQPVFKINPAHELTDSVLINELSFLKYKNNNLYWFEIMNLCVDTIYFKDLKVLNNNDLLNLDSFQIHPYGYNIICNDSLLFKDVFDIDANISQLNIDFQKNQKIQLIHDNRLLDSLDFNFKDTFSISLFHPFYKNNNSNNWNSSQMTPGEINNDYFEFLEEEERIALSKELYLKSKKRKKRILYGATISSVAGAVIYFIVH